MHFAIQDLQLSVSLNAQDYTNKHVLRVIRTDRYLSIGVDNMIISNSMLIK
jgi:hypothetical protein